MENRDSIALITGATSGIGLATARLLAGNKINLIICGKDQTKLNTVLAELAKQVSVLGLCFDLSDKKQVQKVLGNLTEPWRKIDVLINNAGNAYGLDPIQKGDMEDWDKMIDTNVKGLLYVSRMIIPLMVERKSGHIINISSIAGKETYPNGNVYCATKFAVEALSQSMRIDLLDHQIRVSNIAPGKVETNFSTVRFKGDEVRAKAVYADFTPLQPQDIAETIWFVMNRPAHVNISDISILPSEYANATIVRKNKN